MRNVDFNPENHNWRLVVKKLQCTINTENGYVNSSLLGEKWSVAEADVKQNLLRNSSAVAERNGGEESGRSKHSWSMWLCCTKATHWEVNSSQSLEYSGGQARVSSGVSIASACGNEFVPSGRSSNTNKPTHHGVVLSMTRTFSTNRSNVPMSLSTTKSPCYEFWTEKEKKMFHLCDLRFHCGCLRRNEDSEVVLVWKAPAQIKIKNQMSLAGVSEFWRDLVGSMWVMGWLHQGDVISDVGI